MTFTAASYQRGDQAVLTSLLGCCHANNLLLSMGFSLQSLLSPELEYVFPLLIVGGYLTHGLSEADGYLSVVWNAVARALVVFIETKTSLS